MKKIVTYVEVSCFVLAFMSPLCTISAAQTNYRAPIAISKVKLDAKSFNPSKGEIVALSYEINNDADVLVAIYDRLGDEVRRIKMSNVTAGKQTISWDGRDASGHIAPGSVFLYIIEATDQNGRKTVHNPAKNTGGLVVKPHDYTFNRKTGKIEYVLPKACMVRLRAGMKEGMFIGTILDWEPQKAGRHIEHWDGKDKSGMMNLLKHPDLQLNLTCHTLPANTIVRTGAIVPWKVPTKVTKHSEGKGKDLWSSRNKHFHYQHDPRNCREPEFKMLFPVSDHAKNGTVPIRIEVDQKDIQHLINKRFEIMLFVDGTFLFEMEEGSSPFTFYWDTKGLAKGPHIITANLISYDDHIGVESQKVIIGE